MITFLLLRLYLYFLRYHIIFLSNIIQFQYLIKINTKTKMAIVRIIFTLMNKNLHYQKVQILGFPYLINN
jgi:hypothetical protein